MISQNLYSALDELANSINDEFPKQLLITATGAKDILSTIRSSKFAPDFPSNVVIDVTPETLQLFARHRREGE